LKVGVRTTIAGAPGGVDALVLAELAQARGQAGEGAVLFVGRDDVAAARMADALDFFAPGLSVLQFPAWDCLPYDRVSPNAEVVGRRIDTLTRVLKDDTNGSSCPVVLTTVSALLQRVPPRDAFEGSVLEVSPGQRIDPAAIMEFLVENGYGRAETVMEPGEFAVRGGIIDVFPPGHGNPLRLDFFGDELETIRAFDSVDQRTTERQQTCSLKPVSEVPLGEGAITRFRTAYRSLFGAVAGGDALYESVSAGRRYMGMEHWIALFFENRMETVLDYLPGAAVILDWEAEEARDARLDLIDEYYDARRDFAGSKTFDGAAYNPVPPERLYLGRDDWENLLVDRAVGMFSPFRAVEGAENTFDADGRAGKDMADARVRPETNLIDALGAHICAEQEQGRNVVIAAYSAGSRERLRLVMAEHGIVNVVEISAWTEVQGLAGDVTALAVVGLERGFVAGNASVITEQDIFGERLSRPTRPRVRPENFIAEASSLQEGDLVVHVEHGIGRYDGLVNIDVAGAPHDCLRILYQGGDKLFLPVENIELISRYGSEQAGAQLDRLGGAAWQARKARLKKRIRDMADELIGIAAARNLRPGAVMTTTDGLFDEFCARFPYTETDDQGRAIEETIKDLESGRPMDRLICGDVGFGKTEVALRAAFRAVMSGTQVAVVVPTTLLARQHYQVFTERFHDYPVRIEQLSRLVSAKAANETKAGLTDGAVDIVIGTHALLAKGVQFANLGLLVIDEEQRFGVAHKERLKQLRADVHVLTLTATPIPRTLQMALAGVREMSLIATPPVDRLAVRTFILPFDPVIIREAVLRERFRGGQVFYVCPRIQDLDGVTENLRKLVPEVKMVRVHGQMPARELESAMTAFNDGAYEVLLSTNIIESGLDLPQVNTIIIHRADMFGLAQLYQLRGRVGRSKIRAYAYLTLPPGQNLTAAAAKRLEVMHTLDSLGAGFTLASHDLDIRGAGNLLGGEQSGHIREVGIELYQKMLEDAVAEARGLDAACGETESWSPQINVGMAVLIPETYVADLGVRLSLYRRMADLRQSMEIEGFGAELIDRFGPLPDEVETLLKIVAIKRRCLDAGIARVEAGPKGATVGFHNDHFNNPGGLVAFISGQAGTVKLRPDHTLVYRRAWAEPAERLAGVRHLVDEVAKIAASAAEG